MTRSCVTVVPPPIPIERAFVSWSNKRMVTKRIERLNRRTLPMAALLVATAMAACSGGSGIPSPRAELSAAQAMLDLNDAIIQLREENAMMQAEIDSLRGVAARQDTVLRQVAAQAGVPMPADR